MTPLQIGITVASIVQGGAVAILVWVFKRVIGGALVARSVLEDVRKDRDERVADALETSKLWHAAYLERAQAHQVQSAQTGQLLETGRIAEALLRAATQQPHDRELRT